MALFLDRLQNHQDRINGVLDDLLPADDANQLAKAMRYSVLSGGKRLRPTLTYLVGELLGVEISWLDRPAAAIEFIHAYSLVHDDLPAMDNDDFRRGKPTCHKFFDEATAILVGDALQTLAFHILAEEVPYFSTAQCLKMVALIASASGFHGMAGGQALDLNKNNQALELAQIEKLYQLKTGALIAASVELASIAANASADLRQGLQDYSRSFSLAFQIKDDILDIEGTLDVLGKIPGSDQRQGKYTYPTVVGLAEAKNQVKLLHEQAINALTSWDKKADCLRQFTAMTLGL